ncbi:MULTISPECIES: ankyrin repeat domain-containing protein [unclassified Sphingopyxis]|uniref:ankyrin repeat domain-containing protein n=1 Tax=unclassified Sphingopyxis TaxID=2614943 RepID=UPI00073610DD|nr:MULTISPECIES: ankyrin repeat domain-containing protein [unclassified Sphingopyxis]KTE38747.1 hypothetical protein ATE62_10150 [Sphingopyxis sp. HIX]KTE76622.1 hypothetical protein ATE72_20435 [Sphingopyxis sp. HXXIV]
MGKTKRKTLPKDFEALLAAGDLDALKAVFDACNLDARGGVFKQTALAFVECPDELTRWLVAQGADLAAGDAYGETPLHSRAGHWKGCVELLIELGADPNHGAGGRATPLHRAATTGNLRAARALLDAGARADAANRDGDTALISMLRRCGNADIARVTPMAELLLDALPDEREKPRSFFARLLGGATPVPRITPVMQQLVREIGTRFEFHRAGYNPKSVDEASAALDRLYALFAVAPVPRRVLHDKKAPIAVGPGRWEDQHQHLWDLLVPSSGAAATVQGEVIRLSGRIHDELERNGGINWDGDYRKMAKALLIHLGSAEPLPAPDVETARKTVAEMSSRGGDTAGLCRLAVAWVARNPAPILLPKPDYNR